MTTQKNEPDRGFTVIDRRASGSAEPREAPSAASPPPRDEPLHNPAQPLPAVDFAGFVLSLATSALYHMGFVGDPEHDQPAPEPDLPLARQTIDTLEMLQHKTRGNLEAEEDQLLEGVLYELHLRFVEVSK
jgi:hypothetical protein